MQFKHDVSLNTSIVSRAQEANRQDHERQDSNQANREKPSGVCFVI